jgi:CheY-like chemotaxis protein
MSAPEVTNRRILVVDDNRDIHEDFRKLLGPERDRGELGAMAAALFDDVTEDRAERIAFELSFASQGKEGLEMVSRSAFAGLPYALAFVDMRMPPGWDGLETLEQIWSVDPSLQAVICTAYSDRSWEEITERLGATDRLLILKKPFDPIEVRQLALAMTEKWNEHRERERSDAQIRGLMRALPDALCLVSEAGTVLHQKPPRAFALPAGFEEGRSFVAALPAGVQREAEACLQRVLRGGDGERLEYEADVAGEPRRFEARWERAGAGEAVVILRDITDAHRTRAETEARRIGAASSQAQRAALRALPLPLVPVAPGVLAVPLTGEHDAARMQGLAEALVEAIRARKARAVVLDFSGVPALDPSATAGAQLAAEAARAAGAEVILTGLDVASADDDEPGAVRCCATIEEGISLARSLPGAR